MMKMGSKKTEDLINVTVENILYFTVDAEHGYLKLLENTTQSQIASPHDYRGS